MLKTILKFNILLKLVLFIIFPIYSMEGKLSLEEIGYFDQFSKTHWEALKINTDYFDAEDSETYEGYLGDHKENLGKYEKMVQKMQALNNPFLKHIIFVKDAQGIIAFCKIQPFQNFQGELKVDLHLMRRDNINATQDLLTNYFKPYFAQKFPFPAENFIGEDFEVCDREVASLKFSFLDMVAKKEEIIKKILMMKNKNLSSWGNFTVFPCVAGFENEAYAFGFKESPGSDWEQFDEFYKNTKFNAPNSMQFRMIIGKEECYFFPFDSKSGESNFHPLHTFIHERFHQYQIDEFTKKYGFNFDQYSKSYTSEENIKLILHGTYFLEQYLLTKEERWLSFYINSLQQRSKLNVTKAFEYENSKMVQEGLADFATSKLLELLGEVDKNYYSKTKTLSQLIKNPLDYISRCPSERYYLEGYTLAEYLNSFDSEWQIEIEQNSNLLELFLNRAKELNSMDYDVNEIKELHELENEFLFTYKKANVEKNQKFEKLENEVYKNEFVIALRNVPLGTVSESHTESISLNSELKATAYCYKKAETPSSFQLILQKMTVIEKPNFLSQNFGSINSCATDVIFGVEKFEKFSVNDKGFGEFVENLPSATDLGIKVIDDKNWDMRGLNDEKYKELVLKAKNVSVESKLPFIAYKEEGKVVLHYTK